MTLNTSVLITLALSLMRRCAEGCVETFPSLTDSSTECKNTMRTCSVTCQPGKIFYDGSSTKTYRCDENNIWFPSVPRAGCKDKPQALYWIRLTAKYHTSHVASYCLEAHEKALNDTVGNLTQSYLSGCMKEASVGNISISNITSTTSSFKITTVLEFKLTNTLTISASACAGILKINAKKFMTYGSPITCNTGKTSNVTIKGDIVDSNITRCEDHYVLVKDSSDNNHCVLDIPVVGVNSTSYLTQIHEDVALHCEVKFGSSVEYLYWQQDTLNITVDNARYSGGTIDSPSLTIHNVTHEDTGYYTCNVISQSGTGTSLFINLTVVGDVVDEQTTVHHTPTSAGGLTDNINETSTDGLTDNITETSTGGLTYNITETSTGGLTDSITETSTGGLTDGITETKNDQTLYIAIGAGCGGVILIIIVLLIVIKRYTATERNVNRTNENVNNYSQVERNRHYCDLTNNVPSEPDHKYDIIDVDRSQPSNNIVCMKGEYNSVEPDGHLTTNIN